MLGTLGVPGLLVIALILLVFFGRGKIPQIMGDVAKGVTAFRKGLKEEPETGDASSDDGKTIEATVEKTADEAVKTEKTDA